MTQKQLEKLGKDALIDIVLTTERTATNYEQLSNLKGVEIDNLEEKIATLKEIEEQQLVKINKLRKEFTKIASNLEMAQEYTNNVILNSY